MASHTAVFGLQLFTQLIKIGVLNSSTGAFISPYSAFLALVLLLNGAGEELLAAEGRVLCLLRVCDL